MTAQPTGPAYRILTRRLCIRCYNLTDAQMLEDAIVASLEHLKPWMPWAHTEQRDMDARLKLLREFRAQFDRDENYAYGIFNREETRVLGGTGLHKRVGPEGIEIGYWIRADAVNQGLISESTAALTRVAFQVHGYQRVEIYCDVTNGASAAVPKKLGYTLEATLRKRTANHEGKLHDIMAWSMLRDEFLGSVAEQLSAEVTAFDGLDRPLALEGA